MITVNEALVKQVEALMQRLEVGADAIPHDSLIEDRWRKDPYAWARERLKLPLRAWSRYAPQVYRTHKWDGTIEPLLTMGKELGRGHSVAVSSGTGLGKTHDAAVMALWFLDCWEGAQVITLAPKKDQLTLHIWKEIGNLWPLFRKLHPKAELMDLKVRMRPGSDIINDDGESRGAGWGAVGFACGVAADEAVANRARGFHAEHMLFIFEETTGQHDAILNAVKFTCTAPHNLRLFLGNPDSELDALARVSKEPDVIAIRASALDHPNVVCDNATLIPGAQSKKVVDNWRLEYGEEGRLYRSRVRGIAPGEATDSLIRHEWLLACSQLSEQRRGELRGAGNRGLGVDVANSDHGDKGSVCHGVGAVCEKVESWPCPDANAFVRDRVYPWLASGVVKAKHVGLDNVGVGAGAWNELKRLGARVQGLNGGEAYWEDYAENAEVFQNLRAQMYWQARKDISQGNVYIPYDEELWNDLKINTWFTRNGKICLTPKEEIRELLGRSPDKGDAFVYWNWARQANKYPTFGYDDTGTSGVIAGI